MQRPISTVPPAVRALFILGLCLQASWTCLGPAATGKAPALPGVPDQGLLRAAAFGEPATLARLLMLWLQAFDDQPGHGIPFAELDYAALSHWLGALLDLDPRFGYPLLSASRVYTQTPDDAQQRQMLAFVHRRFLEAPDQRWPWLAHAVHVARHRLNDPRLALSYAGALRRHVTSDTVPAWALHLELFILEDLDEPERARVLIGDLLASGRFDGNGNALRFLHDRLAELKQATGL